MSTVRLKRLQADYEKLREYVAHHPRLQLIQTEGTPPERYQLEYRIRSLRQKDDELLEVKSHMVEIALPLGYPRMPPQCRMLTPIFHPNIAPHAICIGDHWSPGEPLSSIVARIGELIAYQSYNTKSPLNGEAAKWVNENIDNLPLDPVSMVLDVSAAPQGAPASASAPRPNGTPVAPAGSSQARTKTAAPVASPAPRPAAPQRAPAAPPVSQPGPMPAPVVAEPVIFACTRCGAKLRAAQTVTRVRCPRCQTVVDVPLS